MNVSSNELLSLCGKKKFRDGVTVVVQAACSSSIVEDRNDACMHLQDESPKTLSALNVVARAISSGDFFR